MKDTAKSQQVSRPFKLNMYEKTSVLDKLLTLKFIFTLNLSIMVNQSIKEYPASNIHKNMIEHRYIQRLQTSQFRIQMHLRLTNPDQNETAYICIKKKKVWTCEKLYPQKIKQSNLFIRGFFSG
jgi:hypothetical protein